MMVRVMASSTMVPCEPIVEWEVCEVSQMFKIGAFFNYVYIDLKTIQSQFNSHNLRHVFHSYILL